MSRNHKEAVHIGKKARMSFLITAMIIKAINMGANSSESYEGIVNHQLKVLK